MPFTEDGVYYHPGEIAAQYDNMDPRARAAAQLKVAVEFYLDDVGKPWYKNERYLRWWLARTEAAAAGHGTSLLSFWDEELDAAADLDPSPVEDRVAPVDRDEGIRVRKDKNDPRKDDE